MKRKRVSAKMGYAIENLNAAIENYIALHDTLLRDTDEFPQSALEPLSNAYKQVQNAVYVLNEAMTTPELKALVVKYQESLRITDLLLNLSAK